MGEITPPAMEARLSYHVAEHPLSDKLQLLMLEISTAGRG
jgi:hypothetical protein